MDDIKVIIRKALLSSEKLVALIGDRVYPSADEMGANPVCPCITLSRDGGGYSSNGFSDDAQLKLDVWAKGGNDEAWKVYKLVREVLHDPANFNGSLFLCRETYVNDNLFEEKTRMSHIASRYKIIKGR